MHADITSMHIFNRIFILYKGNKYFEKKYHRKNLDDKQAFGENVSIFCLNVFLRVENARLSC
ncbi:hypothetical protein OAS1_03150 [Bacillus sp. YKCMOAS1]|nr:hypothetical protein OAS1_03150 [Bacillus sp. YKCMOAS1]